MIELEEFAFELDCLAEWRRMGAFRSQTAAVLLERIAREVRMLCGSAVHEKLNTAIDAALRAGRFPVSELVAYRRQIGIAIFPDSGTEYLLALIEILSGARSADKKTDRRRGQPSMTAAYMKA